jgi:hypothetical protein
LVTNWLPLACWQAAAAHINREDLAPRPDNVAPGVP